MILGDIIKFVTYQMSFLIFVTITLDSQASELEKLNKGVLVGKYITTELKKTSPGMLQFKHLCQYIKSDGNFSLSDVANGRTEVKGQLTDQYFVVSAFMREEDAVDFSSGAKDKFCAVDADYPRQGDFKGRKVTYVSGSMSLSHSMKIRILHDSMRIKTSTSVKKKELNSTKKVSNSSIFKCKDNQGKLTFQDSPCETYKN
jgi:hypothetical protein